MFQYSPFNIKENIDSQANIINPLTDLNTAKGAFRINDVAQYFGIVVDYINFIKIRFDKNNLSRNTNIIVDCLVNCS